MLRRGSFVLCALALVIGFAAPVVRAQQKFTPPSTGRVTYNFNPGWKFIKQEVEGSEAAAFDDSKWETVSTPHTWNDIDSFDGYIARGGEVELYMGPARYRKHFKLPASAQGSKVIIEFEGMRQAAKFWVNGKAVGKYEDGVTACGIDITDVVNFGDKENILAVWITNVTNYQEEATGTVFQWESKDFNPNYGGINRNVRLHILPRVYQTLPLLNGLGTTGTYVYATDHDVTGRKANLTIETQVRNESTSQASVELSAVIVDASGSTVATIKGETYDMVNGETTVMKASGALTNVKWWNTTEPNLYDVYSILTVGGKVADVAKVTTGFRKTAFKGGAGTGGVFINDKFVYLKGYAQRTTNEWAAVGGAYPDWMHDFDMKLLADGHGNYMRWMHIAPKAQEVAACDRMGVVQVCPAGDKEANPPVGQWNQRVEVMRRTIVYFRNSPSILFWEAGNNGITAARMKQMVDIRKELDPNGGRVMGCRSMPATQGENVRTPADNDRGAVAAGQSDESVGVAEWFGVMIAQDPPVERLETPTQMFRAFTYQRRDAAPIIETEDFRDESLRRFWDDFSPPHMGFKRGANDTYNYNSETFVLAAARRYNDYWSHRISLPDPKMGRWSAYASIIWADSNQHGRMPNSAVCRTSGKVDSVRIPKQAYFVHRVMQNEKPDSHIVGHWTYPADTKKAMHVAASNVDSVELFVNGKSKGKSNQPQNGFIFSFADIAFEPGSIKAVGYDKSGKAITEHELKTAGPAAAIKLTQYTGPKGFTADGSDVAFFDFEVVDAQGNRCPTDEARVDFELTGPAVWRGGVNEGLPQSTNNPYLNTECGINRVFIRATQKTGEITLTAKREGLKPATLKLNAVPFTVEDGLAKTPPQFMAIRASQ